MHTWKCISHIFLKISVVNVMSREIIFYVVFKISGVRAMMNLITNAVNDEFVLHVNQRSQSSHHGMHF